ncbi:MAG: DUF501 domain-containing protein [Pseudomonadales bacterium]|nr:DUF501 domain-containing protein [Pseudomonadales bacterium]
MTQLLLGRGPGPAGCRGQFPSGEPMVIRVASLVDDKPFPTLFWLVDADLSYRIDQAEAGGLIKRLQQRVNSDVGLRRAMAQDHAAHIALRAEHITPAELQRLQQLGMAQVLARRGIGGIADFTRIRCLHTWYAAHLVVPNTIGALLEEWWRLPVADRDAAGGHPVCGTRADRTTAPE